MLRPRPDGSRWGPVLCAGFIGVLLGGCSGTPLGEQLSRSFSAPDPATPGDGAPAATQETTAPATPGSPTAAPGAATPPGGATAPTAAQPKPEPGAATPRAPVLSPAPYRITLKLAGADPAAPAEALTEALRAAGVPFEVEMIERVLSSGGAADPAPTTTPAPAPSATPPATPPAPATR